MTEAIDFMKIAKEEAIISKNEGEIPVGCVIAKNGIILSKAHNLKEQLKNPIAHAEIIAIDRASKKLGDWRLNGCEMYVTLEPCPMCAAAIVQSRILRVHIGTFNKDMGACGSVINITDSRYLNSFVDVIWEYDEECSKILTDFFDDRRRRYHFDKQ